jgi:glycosyltransferase involved in cell wall biosynthesis
MTTWCVIVPCFNEAGRLDVDAFTRFVDADPDAHFLFVNDGSGDDTRAVLDRAAAGRPDRLRALHLAQNAGKAEAVRAGANSVGAWKPFTYAGFLDADLSAPIDSLHLLRDALDQHPGVDLAIGSRVALLGRDIRRNAARHYLGRIFATATSLMLRLPVYDTQCGAKLFRTAIIPEVFADPFVTRWFFDVEMIFRLLKRRGHEAGARALVEVPLATWIEKGGTKIKPAEFLLTPLQLFRIWQHYR